MSTAEQLSKLKELLDAGALNDAEFAAQKAQLLSSSNFSGTVPSSLTKTNYILVEAAAVTGLYFIVGVIWAIVFPLAVAPYGAFLGNMFLYGAFYPVNIITVLVIAVAVFLSVILSRNLRQRTAARMILSSVTAAFGLAILFAGWALVKGAYDQFSGEYLVRTLALILMTALVLTLVRFAVFYGFIRKRL